MTSRHRPLILATAASLFAVSAAADRAVAIGQPLPGFQAVSLRGEALSLESAVKGHRAVVILFLSTACPYANYFADHVRKLSETYAARGVLFLGVNSNNWESRSDVIEHAQELGWTFPMIKDQGHAIADRLGARRTPEAFLVDSRGTLRYRGWVKSKQESPDLQRALDAVLAGRAVRRPSTKAFGCAIDRF